MNPEDLDLAYTEFCQTMTELGETQAQLFLARFALLAMTRIGDLSQIRQTTSDAAMIEESRGARP